MLCVSLFFAALVLVITGRVMIKRQIRKTIERQSQVTRGERCICGYSLEQLDMGRCPECGRVVSFNATAEDLGLTKDQLARIAEKRRERADQDPKP